MPRDRMYREKDTTLSMIKYLFREERTSNVSNHLALLLKILTVFIINNFLFQYNHINT